MTDILEAMSSVYLGNSTRAWLIAALIAAVVYAVLAIARRVLISRLSVLAERTETDIDDAIVDLIRNTRAFFIVAVAVGAAIRGLEIHARLAGPLTALLELLVLLQIGLWISGLIAFLVERAMTKRRETADRIGVAAVRAIGVTVKVIAWIILAVVALQFVFEKNVTALLTGIGVGGIALALAVQNILGDLLAAVAIVFDRPFDVGDSIAVDSMVGTVEQIGLKTTRLRSVTGEQLVIGNAELLKSKLRNYKRMYERRAVLHLDVTYDTPPDVVARIPAMMKEIVEAQKSVRFERSHFATFQESALRIETVYFVLDPDYSRFMDVQQAVNLEVLRRFAAQKIRFAFPTRTVEVAGTMPLPSRITDASLRSG
jgi:small-conductance mechanosensitive channel